MTEGDRLIVAKLRKVWGDLGELCGGLSDDQWRAPTDCPGWDVKDQLSHIAGTESWLLGRPAPDHQLRSTQHVRNAIGQQNELQVDWRRSWSPAEVLADFNEVTAERLRVLEGYDDDDWERESFTPVGPGTVRDFMQIRIFDCWVHEQDIRRAVEIPGGLDDIVADHALGRILQAMPFVVGKKVRAPEGSTILFDLAEKGSYGIEVVDGRAKMLDVPPDDPTARISTDFETFACLGCGRWDPGYVMDLGRVEIDGDEDLAYRVVDNLNFMI